jgi:hypothetical protein
LKLRYFKGKVQVGNGPQMSWSYFDRSYYFCLSDTGLQQKRFYFVY